MYFRREMIHGKVPKAIIRRTQQRSARKTRIMQDKGETTMATIITILYLFSQEIFKKSGKEF